MKHLIIEFSCCADYAAKGCSSASAIPARNKSVHWPVMVAATIEFLLRSSSRNDSAQSSSQTAWPKHQLVHQAGTPAATTTAAATAESGWSSSLVPSQYSITNNHLHCKLQSYCTVIVSLCADRPQTGTLRTRWMCVPLSAPVCECTSMTHSLNVLDRRSWLSLHILL